MLTSMYCLKNICTDGILKLNIFGNDILGKELCFERNMFTLTRDFKIRVR